MGLASLLKNCPKLESFSMVHCIWVIGNSLTMLPSRVHHLHLENLAIHSDPIDFFLKGHGAYLQRLHFANLKTLTRMPWHL